MLDVSFKIFLLIFGEFHTLYVAFVCVSLCGFCTHECRCLNRPAEGDGSSLGGGVTDGGSSLHGYWKLNSDPLQEGYTFVTAELLFQPYKLLLLSL